jgi:hypothetical protein
MTKPVEKTIKDIPLPPNKSDTEWNKLDIDTQIRTWMEWHKNNPLSVDTNENDTVK